MTKSDLAEQKRFERAKSIYEKLFGRKWPDGWKIVWNVAGLCDHSSKTIWLSATSFRDKWDLETLIHEMVHLNDELKHGPEFDAEVKRLVRMVRK